MASNKNAHQDERAQQKLKLASKFIVSLLLLYEEIMASKNTDNQ
ncbi:MAG: hypothetical protein AAFZ15_04295 [Bacteroidota bacterium]